MRVNKMPIFLIFQVLQPPHNLCQKRIWYGGSFKHQGWTTGSWSLRGSPRGPRNPAWKYRPHRVPNGSDLQGERPQVSALYRPSHLPNHRVDQQGPTSPWVLWGRHPPQVLGQWLPWLQGALWLQGGDQLRQVIAMFVHCFNCLMLIRFKWAVIVKIKVVFIGRTLLVSPYSN